MKNVFRSLIVLGLAATVAVPFTGCKSSKTGTLVPPEQRAIKSPGTQDMGPVSPGTVNGGGVNPGLNGANGDDVPSGFASGQDLDSDETGIGQVAAGTFDGLPRDREALAAYTIHFAFDSSEVNPADMDNIAAVAKYMADHPTYALEIEGHCDERGTDDYNLALGERRANSAREAVTASGLDAARSVTKSYGESMPVATGTDEASYAANRRGVFVVILPK